ncbi:MAG: tetratricopeptide repeat protein [Pyrinomonadaceae bacterium MAG19_C2-C3]|nr:tetratricopeptide repeat protein [Pyrinomonadaceae bacterium MAG19_C2-C3]
MGFNKAKAVRAAEKYLAQGKIPHAIQEYARIVAADESDITALNMLGDLYARTGKSAEAVTSFTRVAEHYRKQGFALKAIAIYKKIHRLNPQARDVALVLAELYSGQGMIVESRAQFLNIADAYTREGKARDALGILRRIADLDPSNGEVRLRVAEAYAREGFADEAIEAYAEAGARLLERRNPEAALNAFNQALTLQPDNLRALQGFVSAHSALESADEAAEVLEEMIARTATSYHADALYGISHATELRFLLLSAYLAAENPVAAERTVDALVASSASGGNNATNRVKLFLDVARLYMRVGDTDGSVRVIGHALEPMLTEREDDAMLEILNEALARNPEHIQALKFTARIHTWHHDEANLRQTLDRLIEAAEECGDEEEERRALEQIISLSPAEPRHTERLRALGYDVSGYTNENAPVPNFAPASNEVPTFESFMLEADANVTAPAARDDAFARSNDFVFESFAAPVETSPLEWETNGANQTANETPFAFDASSSFADLNDESGSFDSSAVDFGDINLSAVSQTASGETASSHGESSASDDVNGDFAVVNFNHETPSSQSDRIFEALAPELESVDFYLAQGYLDVAQDTLNMLERQYGSHREIEVRRAQCVPSSPVAETSTSPFAPASFVTGDATNSNVVEENDEDAEMLDFVLSPVVSTVSAPDPHVVRDAEVAAFVQSSIVAEVENANAYDAGLAEIFEEFKHAVEEEEVPQTADYETHYNLGIAYQEMGLLDEAVEEFQKAANVCRPEDGTPRYLQCCNMLGHCFMENGLYQLAVMWFRKGVDTPGHTEDEYQALRYELASAYERMGDMDAATNTFMQVYGMDVSYRGVAERLRDLRNKSIVTT